MKIKFSQPKINKKAVIVIISLVGLSVVLVAGLLKIIAIQSKTNKPEQNSSQTTQISNQSGITKLSTDKSKLGILLFGYGGAGHDGSYLTDAIQIVYFDFDKSIITLLSIPRDLWVGLPSGKNVKINEVLTNAADKKNLVSSGAQLLKGVLTDITGLPLNYFIGADFVGFQRAIGINLKGIDVNVAYPLDDPWYPITGEEDNPCNHTPGEIADLSKKYSGFELEKQFPCRYEHLLFHTGINHMQGGEALKYVRSRHGSAEGDIARGKRQQEVLAGVRDKLFAISALDTIPDFFNAVIKNIGTDLNIDILNYLAPMLKKSHDFRMITINLSLTNVLNSSASSNGQFILIPKAGTNNWQPTKEFIKAEIAK